MSTKTRRRREVEEEESDVQFGIGGSREKREANEDEDEELMNLIDSAIREKRSTDENEADPAALDRQKRYFNSMMNGLWGSGGGGQWGTGSGTQGKKEVSESAQMMKTLLMFSKLQKHRLLREYRMPSQQRGSFYGERLNIGGMYGDQLPSGRKRRETAQDNLVDVNTAEEPLSRSKRFLFPLAEPGETPRNPMSQMMSLAMGTARDPNTGKKLEFGGDGMQRIMTNSFLKSMPESMRPPSGKEPNDFVKVMAPMWYFGSMQRSMPFYRMKDPGDYQYARSYDPMQRRNRDGTFGDVYPGIGKKRRKRSTDDALSRHKRQSDSKDSNANDVVVIGDVSIPADLFKPQEIKVSDDYNNYRPPPPQPPQTRYYPVYRTVYVNRPVKAQPNMNYYRNQAYMAKVAAARKMAALRRWYAAQQRYRRPAVNRYTRPASRYTQPANQFAPTQWARPAPRVVPPTPQWTPSAQPVQPAQPAPQWTPPVQPAVRRAQPVQTPAPYIPPPQVPPQAPSQPVPVQATPAPLQPSANWVPPPPQPANPWVPLPAHSTNQWAAPPPPSPLDPFIPPPPANPPINPLPHHTG